MIADKVPDATDKREAQSEWLQGSRSEEPAQHYNAAMHLPVPTGLYVSPPFKSNYSTSAANHRRMQKIKSWTDHRMVWVGRGL